MTSCCVLVSLITFMVALCIVEFRDVSILGSCIAALPDGEAYVTVDIPFLTPLKQIAS